MFIAEPYVRYSALSRGRPEYVAELVQHLETVGFARFWATEHHSLNQSASPLIIAAIAAAAAKHIGVGTAGVMLRYCTPMRLAKDAHLLERMYPDRVDIGVVTGAAPHHALHQALLANGAPGEWRPEEFEELARFVRSPELPFGDGTATAICRSEATSPRLWMCSNSLSGATFAGEQSVGLIFHLPLAGASGMSRAIDTIDRYRSAFRPSRYMERSAVALICAGCCAETDREAHAMWPRIRADYAHKPEGAIATSETDAPSPTFFIGGPETCRSHLTEISTKLGIDEAILYCAADSVSASMRGYELLGEGLGLRCRRDNYSASTISQVA